MVEKKLEEITNEIYAEEERKELAGERKGAVGQELTQNRDKLDERNEEYSKVIKYLDAIEYEEFISSYIVDGKYDQGKVWDDFQRVQNSNNAMKNEIERGMRD